MLSLMDEQEQAALGDAVARMAELAAEGRLAAAARAFAGWPFNDEEIAVAENAGYFEAAGRYVPNLLNLLQQGKEHEGPTPDDPAVLGAISVPVVVLHGRTPSPSCRHRAVCGRPRPQRTVRKIPGAGHAAPLTRPEALAEALTEFFASSPEVQLQL